jgi:hypothetical protein
MKIIIHPLAEPQRELDVTHRLVSAIAEELWRTCGGNTVLNWLEAEQHVEQLMSGRMPAHPAPADPADSQATRPPGDRAVPAPIAPSPSLPAAARRPCNTDPPQRSRRPGPRRSADRVTFGAR